MKHGSLFSGLGGFDLAAEWMGWDNIFHCEWMEFPRKVLDYHFPNADSHIDICKTDFKKYANKIDILTGGFPCQPFSVAGKRKGANDERYLWHEMLRAIQEIKPTFVIAENVANIFNIDDGLVFEQVCLDLEAEGYEVQPFNIPAASKNAPHRRARIWFVATNTKYLRLEYSTQRGNIQKSTRTTQKKRDNATKSIEADGIDGNVTDSDRKRCERKRKCRIITQEREDRNKRLGQLGNIKHQWEKFPTEPPICSGDDGLPTELDGITFSKWRRESIKGYGNAIVPQIALEIFKQLEKLYLEL
jgi:DNA (cytosine-5)-methyltransferase 1